MPAIARDAAAALRAVVGVDRVHEVARHERPPAGSRVAHGVVPLRVAARAPPAAGRHDDHGRRPAACRSGCRAGRRRRARRGRRASRACRAAGRAWAAAGRSDRRRRQVDERAHAVLERARPERALHDGALRRRRRADRAARSPGRGRRRATAMRMTARIAHIMTRPPERRSQERSQRLPTRLRYRAGDAAAPALPPQRPARGAGPDVARERPRCSTARRRRCASAPRVLVEDGRIAAIAGAGRGAARGRARDRRRRAAR